MDDDKRTDAQKAEDAARLQTNDPQVPDPSLAAAEARRQAALDRDAEQRRGDNRTVNDPHAPENVAKQHEQVDLANEKRNEQNREGHKHNMERVEAEAHEAQARTQYADDHRANHTPTGKQTNRNTPRIDKDGTKHWDQ